MGKFNEFGDALNVLIRFSGEGKSHLATLHRRHAHASFFARFYWKKYNDRAFYFFLNAAYSSYWIIMCVYYMSG